MRYALNADKLFIEHKVQYNGPRSAPHRSGNAAVSLIFQSRASIGEIGLSVVEAADRAQTRTFHSARSFGGRTMEAGDRLRGFGDLA
jgi:hypothetical protein